MDLNAELYSWLRSAGVIENDLEVNDEGMYTVPEDKSEQLECGLGFGPVLKRLNKLMNSLEREVTPMPELNSLKELKSPAAKLYNWKVLSSALQLMGIVVDPDSRSLIVAGDREIVTEILKQIYEAEQKALKQTQKKSVPASVQSSAKSLKRKVKLTKKKKPGKDSLYIESIDPEQPLEDCTSCLEILLVSFCKNFNLKPKQAAGLLTQSGKYLEHVVSKGLKGKHEPVQSWYQDMYSVVPQLVSLISAEEVSGSVPMMLSALRSGFLSKSLETALWCCRFFAKLASDLVNADLLPPSWDWFVNENGGLEACIESLTRFKSIIAAPIVNVLVQFGRNNFVELFTIQLRNYMPDSVYYFSTMNELLKYFCEIRTAKQELVSGGIVDYWFELGIRETHPDNKKSADARLAGINFLCDLWMSFPATIENREELGSEILNNIKRALRDKSKLLSFACIGKMFHLLENFSIERNTFAPIIYKTLTFYVVENYKENLIREVILHNFELVFEETPAIPIGILLEPLVKQLQVAVDVVYTTADFEFFVKVAKHPRLSLKNAVQTMDVLGKIYLNDEVYGKAAGVPFMMIATRFVESGSVQEYLFRLVKYSLGLADGFEKRKKGRSQEAMEMEGKERIQRDGMLDLCQFIVKLRGLPLNERILEMICELASRYKYQGKNLPKFTIVLLRLFGDYKEILQLYEKDKNPNADTLLSDPFQDDNIHLSPKSLKPNPQSSRKLIKSKITESADSLPIHANKKGRIMLEIEKIRQNLLEKELEKKVKEENDKVRSENRKKHLRKQLEKRKLELGIQGKTKDVKTEQKSESLSILRELTIDEKEIVGHVLRRYNRVLRLLFKKYSSTGYNKARVGKETFETAADKNSSLSESEFYKLLKEQGVSSAMISLEDSTALLKAFCHRQKKPQIKINFQEFQEMIVQVAIFVYSKYPKDFSHLPPAISVKFLFDYFRSANTEKGISTKFYDEPDPGVGDREIVKKLNILLEKDPNTVLPEGYKRVLENEIEIVYEMPTGLGVSESFFYAVWTLDGILSKSLGVHFLEPIIKVKQVFRARGVLVKPSVGVARGFSGASSKFEVTEANVTFQRSYQPAMAFELNLTSGIKFELARLTGKYPNDLLYESAKLLDDLLHTVDAGSYYLISRNTKQKIVNKVQMNKEQNDTVKKVEAEKQEKKRRLRKQIIEKKLLEDKEAKERRDKEEADKKKKEDEKVLVLKQKRSERNLEMKRKREIEIKEWKDKKKVEDDFQQKVENEKKAKEIERQKKKREQFLKAVRENMHESFGNKHKEKVEEENKRVEGMKKLEQLKEVKRKQIEQKLQKEKQQKEEVTKQKEEFQHILEDPKIKKIFTDYEKSLQLVFTHYCKMTPNKDGAAQNELTFPGFNKFCTAFNVVPGLLPNEEVLKMFRLTTKGKKQSPALAVDYEEYVQSLLRISFKSKNEIGKALGKQLVVSDDALKGLLEYLNLTVDGKQTRDLLKDIDLKSKNLHPREKKRMGGELNKSISREATPVANLSSKKNNRKESDSLSFLLKSGISD